MRRSSRVCQYNLALFALLVLLRPGAALAAETPPPPPPPPAAPAAPGDGPGRYELRLGTNYLGQIGAIAIGTPGGLGYYTSSGSSNGVTVFGANTRLGFLLSKLIEPGFSFEINVINFRDNTAYGLGILPFIK